MRAASKIIGHALIFLLTLALFLDLPRLGSSAVLNFSLVRLVQSSTEQDRGSVFWGLGLRGFDPADRFVQRTFVRAQANRRSWNGPDVAVSRQVLPVLQRGLEWSPKGVQLWRLLARAEFAMGILHNNPQSVQKALDAQLKATELEPRYPSAWVMLGDIYDALDKPKDAFTAYERVDFLGRRETAVVQAIIVGDQFRAEGDVQKAETWFQRAVDVIPNLYSLSRLKQIADLANSREKSTKWEDEIRYFSPESVAPRNDERLTVYDALGMLSAVEAGIWNLRTLVNVLSFRVWRDSDLATGKLLEELISVRPDDADFWFLRGEWYHRRGKLRDALNAYQHVLELDATYARAYLRRGVVLESMCAELPSPCATLRSAFGSYRLYHQMRPEDILGLMKIARISRMLGSQSVPGVQDQLRELADDRIMVARQLGVDPGQVRVGPNLLSNGSFETWDRGAPTDWRWLDFGWGFDGKSNLGEFIGGSDNLDAIDGDKSARIAGLWIQDSPSLNRAYAGFWHGSTGHPAVPPVRILLEPGKHYMLSFYYRTEASESPLAALWLSYESIPFSGPGLSSSTNATWRKVTLLTPEPLAKPLRVAPFVRCIGVGTVWFDQIELREVLLSR